MIITGHEHGREDKGKEGGSQINISSAHQGMHERMRRLQVELYRRIASTLGTLLLHVSACVSYK